MDAATTWRQFEAIVHYMTDASQTTPLVVVLDHVHRANASSLRLLVAAGLIVEDQQRLGWFRFTHALTAEALNESAGRMRRARLHRQIGAAASRTWTGDTDMAAEIARHWLLAAELDPPPPASQPTPPNQG